MSFWYKGHPGKGLHGRQGCQPGCCLSFQNVCVLWEIWESWGGREQAPHSCHIPGGGRRSWGTKNPSPCRGSMASDLPYPLGQLWECLAQVDMSWLLCRAWKNGHAGPGSYCPQHLEKCAQNNQRWASNPNQSHTGWVGGVQVRPGPVIFRDEDSKLHIP